LDSTTPNNPDNPGPKRLYLKAVCSKFLGSLVVSGPEKSVLAALAMILVAVVTMWALR